MLFPIQGEEAKQQTPATADRLMVHPAIIVRRHIRSLYQHPSIKLWLCFKHPLRKPGVRFPIFHKVAYMTRNATNFLLNSRN